MSAQLAGDVDHLDAVRFAGTRPAAPQRTLSRRIPPISAIMIVVLAALLGGWLLAENDEAEPFVDHYYPAGSVASLADVDVRVDDVTSAQAVDDGATTGLFVVIRLSQTNTGIERASIGTLALVTTDDITYQAGDTDTAALPAGFRQTTQIAIIADPARLEGLQLAMYSSGLQRVKDRRVLLDLGIDAERANQLRAAGVGRTLELERGDVEASE